MKLTKRTGGWESVFLQVFGKVFLSSALREGRDEPLGGLREELPIEGIAGN